MERINARLYDFGGARTEGLRTGLPQNEVKHGGNFFEAIYSDPVKLKVFLEGMTGISFGAAMALSEKFPWKDYKTFVDVGGAQGALPVALAKAHPHLTGSSFDLPAVGPVYEEFVQRAGFEDRLSFQGGDFFAENLPSADVIVMGHLLHDWLLGGQPVFVK